MNSLGCGLHFQFDIIKMIIETSKKYLGFIEVLQEDHLKIPVDIVGDWLSRQPYMGYSDYYWVIYVLSSSLLLL